MHAKYQILIDILDKIRSEVKASEPSYNKYNPISTDVEKVNQARAKAFIHLFLKVSFGILEFQEREACIADGTQDGGIDGYYINKDNKTIYFIQSKFRINEKNFEGKEIALEEILTMDVNRILDGETADEKGIEYNGKIKQLQREITELDNIGRYSYQVIILANLSGWTDSKLRQLTGGFATEVFDYEKTYTKLIFPMISGTFYNATDLNINIDLSNKNAGSKISYTVLTKKGECEITVLFVPTIEIGRIMNKYKNSVLKYNPRSYLDLEGKKVNTAITETIISKETNEFALFNNGITMLSDETLINEKIGQKNKAQLVVKNPQIINGGQTSYTLSRIYEMYKNTNVEEVFENKEVLLKVITLLDKNDEQGKIELIEEISTATNQQTPVIGADKFANDSINLKIQKVLFDRYGLLFERKRGEFADGIFHNYIIEKQIIERNLFFRMYYSANGNVDKGRQKKLFMKQDFVEETLDDTKKLDNAYFGYLCFRKLYKAKHHNQAVDRITYAKVRVLTLLHKPQKIEDYQKSIDDNIERFDNNWKNFYSKITKHSRYLISYKDKKTGEQKERSNFNPTKYFDSPELISDSKDYY
ncbi:AIPR protein [Chryseobacterium pennae]|uniref:AIPR protein n=1 Tax=Chryseobacterium pennae TaxID=2258962 RepID=A0A3D9CBH9_9FLAO|nr:AIPR family protein [Chryseobacterium pennae]REC62881.1 AIPR protein [Chryseobacterium pennae]